MWEVASEPGANSAEELPDLSGLTVPKAALLVGVGLGALMLGGQGVVKGAVSIATQLGMSQTLIGLTIVAIGTSLPELATSAMAAWKKNADIAVGNIVGSNIFNIFFILGSTATLRPVSFGPGSNMDVLAVVIASLLLFGAMLVGRKSRVLDRWEAAIFLVCYVAYVVYLFQRESGALPV
jgi:cation:H+ antiporter